MVYTNIHGTASNTKFVITTELHIDRTCTCSSLLTPNYHQNLPVQLYIILNIVIKCVTLDQCSLSPQTVRHCNAHKRHRIRPKIRGQLAGDVESLKGIFCFLRYQINLSLCATHDSLEQTSFNNNYNTCSRPTLHNFSGIRYGLHSLLPTLREDNACHHKSNLIQSLIKTKDQHTATQKPYQGGACSAFCSQRMSRPFSARQHGWYLIDNEVIKLSSGSKHAGYWATR